MFSQFDWPKLSININIMSKQHMDGGEDYNQIEKLNSKK
jgi:hypothetical protein